MTRNFITASPSAVVGAIAGRHDCATNRNVVAVAEIIDSLAFALNDAHRYLIEAVDYNLSNPGALINAVGVEQYSLAALYAKHRKAGLDEVDAMEAAGAEWELLNGYDEHEAAALT